MQFCYKCLGRWVGGGGGGGESPLEPYQNLIKTPPKTVVPDWVVGPTLLGKRLNWPEPFGGEGNEEYRRFGFKWFKLVQELAGSREVEDASA